MPSEVVAVTVTSRSAAVDSLTVNEALSPSAALASSMDSVAVSSSVILKVDVPLGVAPPSGAVVIVPTPTVTDSDAPSSVLSALALNVRVALPAALSPPEKVIVGGLVVRSVLARFE